MKTAEIKLETATVGSLLASRKMTLKNLDETVRVEDESIYFANFDSIKKLADNLDLPVADFFVDERNDLIDGVKIARRNATYSRDEFRGEKKYYTYHHLVTTNADPELMALRLDLHYQGDEAILNSGHGSREVVYVTRGTVKVVWENEAGELKDDEMSEGDSIFIWPNTPHSFSSARKGETAEIIAINYAA